MRPVVQESERFTRPGVESPRRLSISVSACPIQPSRDDYLPGMPRFMPYRHQHEFLDVHTIKARLVQVCVIKCGDRSTKVAA
jgi:hypothetical protein